MLRPLTSEQDLTSTGMGRIMLESFKISFFGEPPVIYYLLEVDYFSLSNDFFLSLILIPSPPASTTSKSTLSFDTVLSLFYFRLCLPPPSILSLNFKCSFVRRKLFWWLMSDLKSYPYSSSIAL
jgi:hypothetical protein